MSQSISVISLPLPLGMGTVNCYLLQTSGVNILIDTGGPNARKLLHSGLENLGCQPGALNLIVITHGDFDHTGNAAYLRAAFKSKIAMHAADAPMAESGDMFANRKKSNFLLTALVPRLIGFGKRERFTPDLYLEDGVSLANFGLDARVLSIPGHSPGSIGILTNDGQFFCGDLLDNTKKPGLNSIMDDRDAAMRSAEGLNDLGISTVYPGHGRSFSLDQLSDIR